MMCAGFKMKSDSKKIKYVGLKKPTLKGQIKGEHYEH